MRREIKFISLTLRNFLSVGDNPFVVQFNNPNSSNYSINIVTGDNGSGKSALICDGLSFALYGRSIRGISKKQLVNSINQGGLFTEVEMFVGGKHVIIKRGFKPTLLQVFVDGVELNEACKDIDTQSFIVNHIIGVTYDTFIQSVVLSSMTYKSFMNFSAKDRRTFIESISGLNVITIAQQENAELKSVTESEIVTYEHQVQVKQTEVDNTNTNIGLIKENLNYLNEQLDECVKQKEKVLSSSDDAMVASLQANIDKVENDINIINNDIKELNSSIDTCQSHINTIQPEIETIQQHYDTFKSEYDNIEPSMNKDLEKLYATVDVEIKELEKKQEKLFDQISLYSLQEGKPICICCGAEIDYDKHKSKLDNLESVHDDVVKSLNKYKSMYDFQQSMIKDAYEQLKESLSRKMDKLSGELQTKKEELDKQLSVLNTHTYNKDKLDVELQHKQSTLSDYNEQLKNFKSIVQKKVDSELETINGNISNIKKTIIANNIKLERYNITLETQKQELDKLLLQLRLAKETLQKCIDTDKLLGKDTGLYNIIESEFIKLINATVNKNLELMQFDGRVLFDKDYNDTIVRRFCNEYGYANLSAGERMRIDLALIFTWRQILRITNKGFSDLMILDEIGDNVLDEIGIAGLKKLLLTKNDVEDSTIEKVNNFIITHNPNFSNLMLDEKTHIGVEYDINLIQVYKDNSFTRMNVEVL